MGLKLSSGGRKRNRLTAWAGGQKTAGLSDVQSAAMDSVYPEWRLTNDEVWASRLKSTAEFVARNGRFPRSGCQDAAERFLGTWLTNQRSLKGKLLPVRAALLDERLPGWNTSPKDAWYARFDEVRAMAADLGRIPRSTEKDLHHRSASSWLRLHRLRPDTDWRVVALNTGLPGWDATGEDSWRQYLSAAVAFVAAHGRLPVQRDKVQAGRSLGNWLQTQRKSRTLTDSRRSQLDSHLPGWSRVFADIWDDALEFVVTFHAANGRFPKVRSADQEEVRHARWITMQRRLADRMSAQRLASLDARLPGWRGKRTNRWNENLEAVAIHFTVNGKAPAADSHDPTEAFLGRWWAKRKDSSTRTPEREAALDASTPGWRS